MRAFSLLLPLLAACTPVGKSGVPLDTALSDLTADDWQSVCEWVSSSSPAEETVTECDGFSVTTGPVTVEECLDSSALAYGDCSATIEDLESCTEAINADPCTGLDDASCAPILLCAFTAG